MAEKNKGILLRKKPYKILTSNSTKYAACRVSLNALCGFSPGDVVYQVRLPNGTIQLVPESVFNPENYL
jgi:hypothetical protein